MSKANDGGPAFPTDGEYAGFQSGMSIRDWFAGQAMNALMSALHSSENTAKALLKEATRLKESPEQFIAITAFEYADAMLAARSKE